MQHFYTRVLRMTFNCFAAARCVCVRAGILSFARVCSASHFVRIQCACTSTESYHLCVYGKANCEQLKSVNNMHGYAQIKEFFSCMDRNGGNGVEKRRRKR